MAYAVDQHGAALVSQRNVYYDRLSRQAKDYMYIVDICLCGALGKNASRGDSL